MAKVKVNTKEMEKQFARVLELLNNKKMYDEIGQAVVTEMRRLIAAGVSPIRGRGRYAAYKITGSIRSVEKATKILTKGLGRKDLRRFAINARSARVIQQLKDKGYPFNVIDQYPNKKVRPVNLNLSGEMMKALSAKTRSTSRGVAAVVGYFPGEGRTPLPKGSTKEKLNADAATKEKGHREGAGGQPSRPTIPQIGAGEDFARSVANKYDRVFRQVLREISRLTRRGR